MALRYERQVLRALKNAPEVSKKVPATDNIVSPLARKADDFPVSMNPRRSQLKPAANEIVVPRTASLKELHRTLCALEGFEMNPVVDAEIKHEGEHGIAAKKLGAHSVFYALRLWRQGDLIAWRQSAMPYKLSTSKLGLAVLTAYPRRLSAGDRQDIEAMGYDGVREIGDRVRLFNNRVSSRESMPLPLSYTRR